MLKSILVQRCANGASRELRALGGVAGGDSSFAIAIFLDLLGLP